MLSGGKSPAGVTDYAPPDWYLFLEACNYLHAPPWEVLKQSAQWVEWALMASYVNKSVARGPTVITE